MILYAFGVSRMWLLVQMVLLFRSFPTMTAIRTSVNNSELFFFFFELRILLYAQANLELPDLRDPTTSVSWVAWDHRHTHHHSQLWTYFWIVISQSINQDFQNWWNIFHHIVLYYITIVKARCFVGTLINKTIVNS